MKKPIFKGSCTAIITPFHENGIDFERLEKQIDYQAEHGTKAIVIAGTTGENATLNSHEYIRLAAYAVRYCAGRMQTILGIGGNDTVHCLRKAELAESVGADAVLMTTPYYNKTTQAGLVEHFTYVADRTKLPMILYNVPSRTSIGISAETYKILSSHPNINGVKEASGDFSLIPRISAECGKNLFIWSGNDDQTVPMMSLGAMGVISVASNIIPEEISKICTLCLAGNFSTAAASYAQIAEFCRLLFIETNPIPIKAAMNISGLDSGILRLPLVNISESHRESLHCVMKEIGII